MSTAFLRCFWIALCLLGSILPVHAQPGADDVLQAREALRKRDRIGLAAARMAVNTTRHPLAQWVEFWELQNRLNEAQQPELDTFAARWPGTYVEDRLRNDWLLELGRRRDWAKLLAEYPRFRMNDDREVSCYALLAQHAVGATEGPAFRTAARAAWLAQRDLDDGCALMARTLYEARVFSAADAWEVARLAVEGNRPRTARAAAALVNPAYGPTVGDLFDNPVRWWTSKPAVAGADGRELALLALMRMAASDPELTASQLGQVGLGQRLPMAMAATAWAHVAKQAALKQQPQAADHARLAWELWDAASKPGVQPAWTEDLLAWHVRAGLREPSGGAKRWALIARAVGAMPAAEQADGAWIYWQARAAQALAKPGADGDAARASARQALEGIAPQVGFYGKLATEELGNGIALPAAPLPLTAAERDAARQTPGFARALQLIAIGLRSEGVREWNFTLRGLNDRELRAAAQLACDNEVWDRCINTSERTRGEIDVAQRFPMPWRAQVVARAREAGLDPALLYGLIRQESRFVADARSAVGASGLMQLMPATARETAKKAGLAFSPEMVTDRDLNLKLGAAYLRRVLDDFGGSVAMAAAAYNAGPGRPRRWREGGAPIEPAAWAESIPFNETRDYVKKVLSNSVDYALLLGTQATPPTLKARLGPAIGPRSPNAPAIDRELP